MVMVDFEDLTVKAMTANAVLVFEGSKDVWLPVSQIELTKGEYVLNSLISFEIPEWLAFEKGMI